MLSIELFSNDSPLHGNEGTCCTVSHLRESLRKETETNVAIRIDEGSRNGRFITAPGDVALRLGTHLDRTRREGLEFMI